MRAEKLKMGSNPRVSGPKAFIPSLLLLGVALLQGCAVRIYRPPPPPAPSASAPQIAPVPKIPEPERRAVVEESRIKEEELKAKRPQPQARGNDRPPRSAPAREAPVPLPDDNSLIAKINPRTPPQRAVSLRLTEEGRKLIESGEYAKALARLEKSISIDSTNPYGYYYLGRTHFRLGRYQESLNFLDVAESLFADDSFWLAEVFALKGEDFRALGLFQKADSSYAEALRLNPGNRLAAEGLSSLRAEDQPSSR